MTVSCAQCDSGNPDDARFCARCGSLIERREEAGPAVGTYTPPHLQDQVLLSEITIEGERKQVTILFCDIVESTRIAAQIGAENMHRLLDRFFESVLAEVHGCGGTLNQFLGDGFMALFGAPVAYEDHARRAATAALAVRERCHAERIDLSAGRVPIRMGLNTGPVIVGAIGDRLRMDYTAIGDTVNLAARMEQGAASGEILMARTTWLAARDHFNCERLADRRVKGKSRSVPVFRLHDGSPSRTASRATSTARPSAMVGRGRELTLIRDHLAALARGDGGLLTITGPAGIGKSRLLHEACRSAEGDVYWLQGHALSFGRNMSYAPFREALRGMAHLNEVAAGDEAWNLLEAFAAEKLGPDARQLLPFLGLLLGMEPPTVAAVLLDRLNPTDIRSQIFIVARRLFEALTGAKPTVLALEDWHWADEASVALLHHILPLTRSLPLLICVTTRSEDSNPRGWQPDLALAGHSHRHTHIELGALSKHDSAALISGMLGEESIAPHRRRAILQLAEGNPLFIEEVALALQSGPETSPDIPERAIDIPSSLEALILARIDRLRAEEKQILRHASVIGRNFYTRVLQELESARATLDERLAELQRYDLILAREASPEPEFMFKHVLVQEASYHSILESRRQKLHEEIGTVIERLFHTRLNELANLLAYHYSQARNEAKARQYLLRAGDHAARISADVEALSHYEQAMQSYLDAFGEHWDKTERASLERRIGEAQFRLGEHDVAIGHLTRSLKLLGHDYPRTAFGVKAGIVWNLLKRISADLLGDRLPSSDAPLAAADDDRMRAYVALGWIDWFHDPYRFFYDVLFGLNWAYRHGVASGYVQGLVGVGIAAATLGAHRYAARCLNKAETTAARFGNPSATAFVQFGFSELFFAMGRLEESVAAAERALHDYRGQGKVRELVVCAAQCSTVLQLSGDFPRARRLIEEIRRLTNDCGDPLALLYASERAAVTNQHAGQLSSASAALAAIAEELRAIPDYQIFVFVLGSLADCTIWMGDLDRAGDIVSDGLHVARMQKVASENVFKLAYCEGIVAFERLKQPHADRKRHWRRRLKRAATRMARLQRSFVPARSAAFHLKACLAWVRGNSDRACLLWERAISAAEESGALYERECIAQVMGRCMYDTASLERVLTAFERFECRFKSAQTMRLLGEVMQETDPARARHWYAEAQRRHESMEAAYERSLVAARLDGMRC